MPESSSSSYTSLIPETPEGRNSTNANANANANTASKTTTFQVSTGSSTDAQRLSLNDFIKNTYASMNEDERETLLRSGGNSFYNATSSSNVNVNVNVNSSSSSNHNVSSGSIIMDDNNTVSSNTSSNYNDSTEATSGRVMNHPKCCSLRRFALELSLYWNLLITFTKLVAYVRTNSLSVLAALLDSVLDVVSQAVLNYTETHSTMSRSSAFYPAGAARLEPIGVLTCAALMGMASFEVLKESFETLLYQDSTLEDLTLSEEMWSFWSIVAIVGIKLGLLWICQKASHRRQKYGISSKAALQLADPTLEALAQDHWNDALSNGVAAMALLLALYSPSLWWLDPLGAILISLYIIYSWYHTGQEQIEQLTGKSAPADFIEELLELAEHFDGRMMVDTCRAYHFGPKFLVELEVVMPQQTLLKESHDLGMELQYEIEAREEVERCFVHIDYETRPYDEHVVSKVPELREHLHRRRQYKSHASV